MSGRRRLLGAAIFAALASSLCPRAEAQQKNQIRFPTSEELRLTLRRADELADAGQYAEALELYTELLALDRKDADALRVVEVEERLVPIREAKAAEGEAGEGDPAPEREDASPEEEGSLKKDEASAETKPPAPKLERRLVVVETEGGKLARDRVEGRRKVLLEDLTAFTPRRFLGVTQYVHNRLFALPPAALDIYREKHDYRAKAAFEKALKAGDERSLELVYQEFVASSIAPQVLRRLAGQAFEVGALSRALDRYRLLASRHADVLGPKEVELALRRALAAAVGLGDLVALREVARELGVVGPEARVSFAGEALTVDELAVRAAALAGGRKAAHRAEVRDIGGAPTHVNRFEASLHIGRPHFLPKSFMRTPTRGSAAPSPFSPRPQEVSQDVVPVIVQAPRRGAEESRLEPLALLATGYEVASLWISDGSPGPRIVPPTTVRERVDGAKVMHGGALGRGMFVASFVMRIFDDQNFKGIPITIKLPDRKLCALDTEKWRWAWNQDDLLKGTRFETASFPAPPVIVDDTVYAPAIIIEGFVQSYVMAFDLESGALKWATWVCAGQVEQTMFGEHAREPLASPVAVRDGVVYHCSSLGAVAAIDARTGTPRWMTSYEQIEIEPPKGYYPVHRTLGWANNPPLVDAGVVVATPLDSDLAVAFDCETGARIWRSPRSRFDPRGNFQYDLEHILGAEMGYIVLSGPSKIECIELRTGRAVWQTRSLGGGAVAGRGVIANGEVCVPVRGARGRSSSYILPLDLKGGEQGSARPGTPQAIAGSTGGDIVVFGDTVLLLGQGVLSAYENKEPRKRTQDF